jgi:hypothetical protein
VGHKGLSRLLGVPALVMLAMTMSAGPGYAAGDQGTTIILTDPLPTANPCPQDPEAVTLTGTMRMTVFFDPLTFDTYIRDNSSDLRGVGTVTGSPYVVNQTDYFNFDTNPSGTTVSDTVDHLDVISHGIAVSFKFHVTIHTTINSNSVPTASVYEFHSTCT